MAISRFVWNDRLKIHIPQLEMDWEQYGRDEQTAIIERWEQIRGSIPDRIMDLERCINRLQAQLNEEADFERSCLLNYEIADQASRINDLWIWYRMNQQLELRRHS